ncbi:MAG: hypothetical protein WC269_02050 [Candidatus Gracilibacteria bacterium]
MVILAALAIGKMAFYGPEMPRENAEQIVADMKNYQDCANNTFENTNANLIDAQSTMVLMQMQPSYGFDSEDCDEDYREQIRNLADLSEEMWATYEKAHEEAKTKVQEIIKRLQKGHFRLSQHGLTMLSYVEKVMKDEKQALESVNQIFCVVNMLNAMSSATVDDDTISDDDTTSDSEKDVEIYIFEFEIEIEPDTESTDPATPSPTKIPSDPSSPQTEV